MSKILMTVMLGALLVCAGCADSSSDTAGAADVLEGVSVAGFLNTNCPIMGDEIDAEDGGSVEYEGHKIGFCCPKCGDKFGAMNHADKVAALAKVGTKLP